MTLNTEGFGYVYWIHKKSQKDFTKEGYIGVSKNPTQRWNTHIKEANRETHTNPHLQAIINKYEDDLEYEVIFGGTLDQCYNYEMELRPKEHIGYNIAKGGRYLSNEARQRGHRNKKKGPRSEKSLWRSYKKKNGYISFEHYQSLMKRKAFEEVLKRRIKVLKELAAKVSTKKEYDMNKAIYCVSTEKIYSGIEEVLDEYPNFKKSEILKRCRKKLTKPYKNLQWCYLTDKLNNTDPT